MVLLLFGPPGCGKGTQAVRIAESFHIPAISTGDLLRAEVAAQTDLGLEVKSILASGGLVSDKLVTKILLRRLKTDDCKDGYLLDGYPRTLDQAETLDRFFKKAEIKPISIHLDVPEDVITSRITSRRQCPKCKAIYNVISQPPRVADICDNDAEPLITRADDKEDVVRARLQAYHELTGPAIEFFSRQTYHRIDGQRSPAVIFEEIQGLLQAASVTA